MSLGIINYSLGITVYSINNHENNNNNVHSVTQYCIFHVIHEIPIVFEIALV